MSPAHQLEEAIATLYRHPPARFEVEREALVERTRMAGDELGAARVRRLPAPSLAAYWVNQLAVRWPAELTALLELGPQLREASARRDHAGLQELDRQRRVRTDALLSLLWHHGEDEVLQQRQRPSTDTLTRVLETLTAAVMDPHVAHQVGAGRLSQTVVHQGFSLWQEDVSDPEARVTSLPHAVPASSDAFTVATAALVDAENRLSAASETVASLTTMLEGLEHELVELTRDRDSTRARLETWRRTVRDAEREVRLARARLDSLR